MSLLDDIVGEMSERTTVEVVTMHPDLSDGVTLNDARPFETLQAALAYARSLAPEERERSWIRCGDKVQTLETAEKSLAGTALG
jgi:hypothetical protein